MKDVSAIYDANWVQQDILHPGSREEFYLMADAVYRMFRPSFVYDYGCAAGWMLHRFDHHGVFIQGYEGSVHCIAAAPIEIQSRIRHADLTQMQPCGPVRQPGELVICTEVAEHLDEQHADHLVDLLCAHMAPIIFTAAKPGQGGHDHVNEQPMGYWVDKFHKRGALANHELTGELGARWDFVTKQVKCMPQNLQVFT